MINMESDSSCSSTGSAYDLDIVPYTQQKKKIKEFYINHPKYKNIKAGDNVHWITKEPAANDPEAHIPFNEGPWVIKWIDHDAGELYIEYGAHYGWGMKIYEIFLEEPSWEDIVARKLELKL